MHSGRTVAQLMEMSQARNVLRTRARDARKEARSLAEVALTLVVWKEFERFPLRFGYTLKVI